MQDTLTIARDIIRERANAHPGSPFYSYAVQQMELIDTRLASGVEPDRAFYESLTHGIGLMCARELEASDPAFCDAVFNMIEHIRTQVV